MRIEYRILLIVATLVMGFNLGRCVDNVWVELRAPRYVIQRHGAALRCEHNADPDLVYKVVFFKAGARLMQYVRGRLPPFELYNFTGADVDLEKATPTSITLDRMDFSASGAYACEVALETPLYSKISKVHEITVIMPQKHAPRIKIKNRRFWARDTLEAVCHSAPAHPAPHLTWFINNVKVDERFTTPHGLNKAHRHQHGGVPLATSNCSLHYPLARLRLLPNESLEISCVATIPSYVTLAEDFADVQKNTVLVNVVRREPAPTQLPVKVVRLEESQATTASRATFAMILVMSVLHSII